ncbi:hypothetical protein CW304_11960 [Bacillus sp. UFRGS-B20]|nr:hypothetical protein CW304_11960 [Bacillus sp. UFRGS-B20]
MISSPIHIKISRYLSVHMNQENTIFEFVPKRKKQAIILKKNSSVDQDTNQMIINTKLRINTTRINKCILSPLKQSKPKTLEKITNHTPKDCHQIFPKYKHHSSNDLTKYPVIKDLVHNESFPSIHR